MSTMQGVREESLTEIWDELVPPCFAESHGEPVPAEWQIFVDCGCTRMYCEAHMDEVIEKHHAAMLGTLVMSCPGFGRHGRTAARLIRWERL